MSAVIHADQRKLIAREIAEKIIAVDTDVRRELFSEIAEELRMRGQNYTATAMMAASHRY